MDRTPPTPDPTDHAGPSSYEGWDPTPDPVGEVDIPAAAGSGRETVAPGIAFDPGAMVPGDPSTAPGAPDATTAPDAVRTPAEDDEVTSLRERLAFYESFDSLIRDNIDRAGALLREAATKQVDAEVRLRTTTAEFEQRQIQERSGYRKVFGSLLDDVSTLQQQVERLARRVSDALDDLELQLPAAGELAAMERGQAPGMTGLAAASTPAGLPSGASSAAWLAHDDDLPADTGSHATSAPPSPAASADAAGVTGQDEGPSADASTAPGEATEAGPTDDHEPSGSEPLAEDDLGVVEEAVGVPDAGKTEPAGGSDAIAAFEDARRIDPDVVIDVLTEGTDADPAVAGAEAEPATGAVAPTDLSELPEEFGLENDPPGGGVGVVDDPYVEVSETTGYYLEQDPADVAPTRDAESGGFPVSAADGDEGLPDAMPVTNDEPSGASIEEDGGTATTPLQAAAPEEIDEVDGGFSPDGADPADEPAAASTGEPTGPAVASETDARAPYGDQAPSQCGIQGGGVVAPPASSASVPTSSTSPSSSAGSGVGEPPTKLRRFEPDPSRPTWGSVPPARMSEPVRPRVETAAGAAVATTERDTIVLVHGVPRATTALSLKRYLEGLEAVRAVEPREYAEGVLRLQVTGERPIRVDDLSGWPDGSGLQEILVRDDLVEIRLPG